MSIAGIRLHAAADLSLTTFEDVLALCNAAVFQLSVAKLRRRATAGRCQMVTWATAQKLRAGELGTVAPVDVTDVLVEKWAIPGTATLVLFVLDPSTWQCGVRAHVPTSPTAPTAPTAPTEPAGAEAEAEAEAEAAAEADCLPSPRPECVVCLNAEPAVVFRPCGHFVVCYACAWRLKTTRCIMCDTHIGDVIVL